MRLMNYYNLKALIIIYIQKLAMDDEKVQIFFTVLSMKN